MQLYLIRHAQSTNNVLWSETGGGEGRVADPELTAVGVFKPATWPAFYLAPIGAPPRWLMPTTKTWQAFT
jgi:2,3-bisphosphoglycerate-dependent phosphoglycerate mutase